MDDDNVRPINRHRSPGDKILDEINNFLNELGFGKVGGSGSRRSSNGSGRGGSGGSFVSVLIIILFILVGYGAFSSFFTVQPHELGVVTRFGEYVKTVDNGLHFKIPFGVDDVVKVPISSQPMSFGYRERSMERRIIRTSKDKINEESIMLTGDLNVATVEWKIEYRVSDPRSFLFSARDPVRNVNDLSLSIMRRVVGNRSVSSVLTTDRIAIAVEAKELTQELIDKYELGINIVTLKLQDVNPPDEVKPAFNEVNVAKQEQEETINNAEKEYNRIIPEARGKADKQIADAQGYAISTLNKARGESQRFASVYASYRKSPEVTKKRLYLETVEEVMTSLSRITVVDSDLKGIIPLYHKPDVLQDFIGDDNKERIREK